MTQKLQRLRLELIVYCLNFLVSISCTVSFSQNFPSNCEIDGNIFLSDCIKYKGVCQNNKANGWGNLYFKNNNILSGYFKENIIQNFVIEYFSAINKSIVIGPNKVFALHGPCIYINNGSVSLANYYNGTYIGNSESFEITQPTFEFKSDFCDIYGLNSTSDDCKLIPKSSFIIYASAREYNSAGDKKYWLTVVDLKSNKIVQSFGSYEKPLTIKKPPLFLGFNPQNDPVYKYADKFFELSIGKGISVPLKTIPENIRSEIAIKSLIKTTSYNDLKSNGIFINEQYKVLKDSSYITLFNSKTYVDSFYNRYNGKNQFASSLVLYKKNHLISQSINLSNYYIYSFDVNEYTNRIALIYGNKDSIFLSQYDLRTFNYINDVFRFENISGTPGVVKYSNSGKYLFCSVSGGTIIYTDNKLHFGVLGKIYDLNYEENVAISCYGDVIYAYDLQNKIIIWKCDVRGRPQIFKIDENIFTISNTGILSIDNKVVDKGIKISSFKMPKMLLSFKQFDLIPKRPESAKINNSKNMELPIESKSLTQPNSNATKLNSKSDKRSVVVYGPQANNERNKKAPNATIAQQTPIEKYYFCNNPYCEKKINFAIAYYQAEQCNSGSFYYGVRKFDYKIGPKGYLYMWKIPRGLWPIYCSRACTITFIRLENNTYQSACDKISDWSIKYSMYESW